MARKGAAVEGHRTMFTSPLAGLLLGFLLMAIFTLRSKTQAFAGQRLLWGRQIFSAGSMGFMHGTNDAQKTMGIIALTLLAPPKPDS